MPVYLISKIADPIFALTIGTSAALLRIQRDQREKFPEQAKDIGIGHVVSRRMGREGLVWECVYGLGPVKTWVGYVDVPYGMDELYIMVCSDKLRIRSTLDISYRITSINFEVDFEVSMP
ncbi:uncharacterized protein An07g10000 [Aspergillus niger]|uniref:Contig An07c0380, genomic contig n=2 Tax=Aspergillus niger TaxID=5061 RepID=A2QPM9_ASPNC|nr:uncharacterized protein An07g10000 [Aspergillus niger]CAK45129.1 unnamed protein product [Aspergillus niger]